MRVDGSTSVIEAIVAGDKLNDFENFDDLKIINDCMWLLEKFLSKPLKPPTNMIRSKWLTHDSFLGSFSYSSLSSTHNSVQQLAKSVRSKDDKPILLFAGEATDERYQGSVQGAMHSGLRAAQELIDFYQKPVKNQKIKLAPN